ncbi:MAG: sulfatase-like hydrolase/transferase, partial [Opitutaceae bacterium]
KRERYNVHLYPWHGFANESIYYDEAVASNFRQRPRPLAEKLLDVARLVDLGIFRSLPQYAKRLVHDHAGLQLAALYSRVLAPNPALDAAPDPDYAELGPNYTFDNFFLGKAMGHAVTNGRVTASGTRPVFKFYHLSGLHVPVRMDRDFHYGHYDYTRANFSQQAEAYARIIGAFLDELKQLDLYDNSMIIILGDHGSGRAPELHTKPTSPERTDVLNRTAVRNDFQRDKARGIPLLLVKRFGEKGGLKASRVPASLVDLPATVLAELAIKRPPVEALAGRPEFHGTSVFALREDEPRLRYYGAMRWAGEKSDYVNPITLYRVDGFSWADESWSFVQVLEPKK